MKSGVHLIINVRLLLTTTELKPNLKILGHYDVMVHLLTWHCLLWDDNAGFTFIVLFKHVPL